jgi:peptide/nickel transport system permease protein
MNRTTVAGLSILMTLALLGFLAPALAATGMIPPPDRIDVHMRLRPPGPGHWLGTDEYGRDVLSRLLHGAATSLTVAAVATFVALGVGVPAGALAGARGGIWDLLLTRLMEATAALPALPLLLLIASLTLDRTRTRSGALVLLAAAIGITRWATIARHVRGGIFRARVEDHAAAAIALGAGRARLLARHLLPGALSPALVSAAFGAGSAVLLESALSFLGLGAPPPAPSWGKMVAESIRDSDAWWLLAAPGTTIALLVMGFNLLAEGMRQRASDPSAGKDRPQEA